MVQVLEPIKIAVAADGGPSARCAMELLTRIGSREQLEVTVLSVVPTGPQRLEHADEIMGSKAERRIWAGSCMRDAVLALGRAGFPAKGLVVEGRAEHELTAAVKESGFELVVVGSGSRSVLGHLILGSVSTYVLDHSPSSVLVVHSLREAKAPARILLGIDGPAGGGDAVAFMRKAIDPDRCHVKIASIVAADPIAVATTPGVYIPMVNEDERHRLRVKAEHVVDEASSLLASWGFSTSSVVADGPVERTLERMGAEWDADLTVVGSRRLGRRRRILLGSVGSALARRTPATLVVRDRGPVTIDLDDVRTRHPAGV